jgi:predicted AlkP superfamily phosphohydrolase/phosphomutase
MSKKIVIIGLDGVPYGLLDNLAKTGIMPNTQQIIQKGIFRKMQSCAPEVSSVAWSSIITGKNPGGHGIFGFTDLCPNSYKLMFPNFNDLKSPPFWNLINERSIIINVPATYPVKEMNGVHISGFVSVDIQKSVYPRDLIPKLQELDYRLDVDSEKAHKSFDLFLDDLDKNLIACIKTYQYLWDTQEWRVFMLVFTGTDRLMHFLWEAYEDENHRYHRDFLDHFRKIDAVIGEIDAQITEDDLLIMLSDHGFEALDKDFNINYLLEKEGFLKFIKEEQQILSDIDFSTKAFALDPARIYINFKNRYPRGSCDEQDKEKILRDLESLFQTLESDHKKVISEVYRKEEIYSGSCIDKAPDLVLVGNKGFNLRARLGEKSLFRKDIFTGKHTRDDAFILVKNLTLNIPENPTVFDVSDTILGVKNKNSVNW